MDVDTIASVSTAPGIGAIAVVRMSGPRADEILQKLMAAGVDLPEPRVATLVGLREPESGEALDRAVVTRFRAPASYSGEDMVEISCHGGWLVPGLVLEACLGGGARMAEPGEFTRRAYLHGRLDLVQVEAVSDLIEGRSRALHRAAMVQLDRGLSQRIADLRSALVRLEALLSHHIDFPEEDDAPVPLEQIDGEAAALVERLDRMLATAPEGELLRDGALAVLAGRPNVGKSSLYNTLLGEERAIVTEEPGTTRDALEASVQLGGFPFRLVDTAGLREGGERIEMMGIEVTKRYLSRADLVLLCVESAEGVRAGERAFLESVGSRPVVLVETKCDLVGESSRLASDESVAGHVQISARTGEGLDDLKDLLPRLIYSGLVSTSGEVPVLTRRRQARALEEARNEVQAFRAGLAEGLPAEVAASHLRPAETALEELLGVISVDDVLDVVFSEFCVGK